MQESQSDLWEQTTQLIQKHISMNPLITRQNESANFVNPVEDEEMVLLSSTDVLKMDEVEKKKVLSIDEYWNYTISRNLKEELQVENNNDFIKIYLSFKEEILKKLMDIERTIKLCSCGAVSIFLTKYGNGLLNDQIEFTKEFEKLVSSLSKNKNEATAKLKRVKKILDEGVLNVNRECDLMNDYLKLLVAKPTEAIKVYSIPKSFEHISKVEVNHKKCIPHINGIDVHPIKTVYAAMGCNDGALVIIDEDTNKEIKRIKLNNNSGNASQNCLWSPSGEKIMVSTRENHSIYIYDEVGQNLLKSIKKTCSQKAFGAIWLSEQEVAVGYEDGLVKFFNVDEGKEIGNVKVNANHAWGMDCLDRFHLLVGDGSGSISNINWKNNKFKWVKAGWHSSYIRCLKLSQSKTKLLTGCHDGFVKLMKQQDQSQLWEFKLNSYINGVLWVPGKQYLLALSYNNQLVALNSKDGTEIICYNVLSTNLMSLRLNPRTAEIYFGDNNGTVQKLKICQQ